jgi:large subunit ribosomal protein L37Ae
MAKSKLGAAGRFGVRYGQLVKRRISAIEGIQRKKQICHLCGGKAHRLSKGIWQCKKCGKKFAGHAYYLAQQEDKVKEAEAKVLKNESVQEDKDNKEKKTKTSKKTSK